MPNTRWLEPPFLAGVHSLIQQDFSYGQAWRLPCPPDLTLFKHIAFCFSRTKRNGLQRELPAISKMVISLYHGGFSSGTCCKKGLAISKQSTFPPALCKHKTHVLDLSNHNQASKSLFQISTSLEEKHYWFGTRQASQPFSLQQRHTQLNKISTFEVCTTSPQRTYSCY